MAGKRFAKIYRNAPSEIVEELLEFRKNHPPVRREIEGVTWTWRTVGEGPESLLILPGATGDGEQPFRNVTALGRDYRVVSADYAAVATIEDLVDGLAGVMDAEGVEAAHVVGGSYGGMVAQCLMRKYPERVRKVVLSHTAAPREEGLRKVKITGRLLPLLPMWLLRKLSMLEIKKQMKPFPEAGAFYVPYFREKLALLKKADIKAMTSRVIDLYENYRFKPGDFADWKERILIIEAASDRMVPDEVQQLLRDLYPTARVHTFEGTGHVTAVVRPEEYVAVIREFLAA